MFHMLSRLNLLSIHVETLPTQTFVIDACSCVIITLHLHIFLFSAPSFPPPTAPSLLSNLPLYLSLGFSFSLPRLSSFSLLPFFFRSHFFYSPFIYMPLHSFRFLCPALPYFIYLFFLSSPCSLVLQCLAPCPFPLSFRSYPPFFQVVQGQI